MALPPQNHSSEAGMCIVPEFLKEREKNLRSITAIIKSFGSNLFQRLNDLPHKMEFSNSKRITIFKSKLF